MHRPFVLLVFLLALSASADERFVPLQGGEAPPGASIDAPVAPAAGPTNKRRAVRFPVGAPTQPQTVVLTPSKDNTLYEHSAGLTSNGQGIHLFTGATAGG